MRYIMMMLIVGFAATASAEESVATTLPTEIAKSVKAQLEPVGKGTYRKFGFRVYNATLWAPGGSWDAEQPYALQLQYTRELSKETLVDAVYDDIAEQNVADEPTLVKWKTTLNETLPEVKENDEIVGLYLPGKDARLFFNGKQVGRITDASFTKAFFNIWLGNGADKTLRAKLLGHMK